MVNENETPEQREMREQLQRIAAGSARMLKSTLLGSKIGFALVLYDFGNAGNMAYAADGAREDLCKMLRELADKLEADDIAKRAIAAMRRADA